MSVPNFIPMHSGDARGKIGGSTKSLGFILWGPQMSVQSWQSIRQLLRYFTLDRSGGLTDIALPRATAFLARLKIVMHRLMTLCM